MNKQTPDLKKEIKFTDAQIIWLNQLLQNSTNGSFEHNKRDRIMCDKILDIVSEEVKKRGYFNKFVTKKEKAKYGY